MKKRLTQLDGIRALLCLSVVFSHFMGSRLGWVNYNFVNAYISVDGFFILSGFVLSYIYSERINNGQIGVLQFSLHRVARLYPLHIFTLLLTFLIYKFLYKNFPFENPLQTAIQHIFMLQGLGLSQSWSWNDPSWSISVELFAAILLFKWIIPSKNNEFLLIFSIIIYTLVLNKHGSLMAEKDLNFYIFSSGLLKCIAGMTFGVFIKNLVLLPKDISVFFVKNIYIKLLAILFVSVFIFRKEQSNGIDLSIIILMGYIIAASISVKDYVFDFFSSKILAYIGKISFSIYMIHTPLLLIMDYYRLFDRINIVAGLLFFCAVLFVLSILTYNFIEENSYKRLKKSIDSFF
nr:acyltransferase [Serratia fonticola]